MPKLRKRLQGKANSVARDLLEFRDEINALNACNAFVLQALAGAMESGEAMSSRAAKGAVLCAQWLGDRAVELEQRLKNIRDRAVADARPGKSPDRGNRVKRLPTAGSKP